MVDPPQLSIDATTPKGKSNRLPDVGPVVEGAGADSGDLLTGDAGSSLPQPSESEVDGEAERPPCPMSSTPSRARMPRLQIQSYLGFSPMSMWRGKSTGTVSSTGSSATATATATASGTGTGSGVSASTDGNVSGSELGPLDLGSEDQLVEEGRERIDDDGLQLSRSDSSGSVSVNGTATDDSDGGRGSGSSSTSVSTTASSTSDKGVSSHSKDSIPDPSCDENEGEDEEDDRCTVRGASTPTTPTVERPESVFGVGGGMLNTLKAHVQRRSSATVTARASSTGGPVEKDLEKREVRRSGSKSKSRDREQGRERERGRSGEREEEVKVQAARLTVGVDGGIGA